MPTAWSVDTITNTSSAPIVASVQVQSCGVVGMVNNIVAAAQLLPRAGTAFAPTGGPSALPGSGAITFDSSGYASGIATRTLGGSPSALINLTEYDYGYGIWFRSTATSGRIFGFGSQPTDSPSSGTTTYDRTLSISGANLVFAANGAKTATAVPPPGSAFNDGAWHYAYVSLRASARTIAGLGSYTTDVTIFVDGVSRATSTATTSLGSVTGYWSLGGGGFTGSVSNATIYNATNSPTTPPAVPYSAASAWWPLNDNGYTVTTAPLPSKLQNACKWSKVSLTYTNPSYTLTNTSLDALANNTAVVTGTIAPGAMRNLTISTTAVNGHLSDLNGLHLYVPITFSYAMSGATNWVQNMVWSNDPSEVFWG